jgi:nitrite reductase/ring-hydroxylating ferredoxin subunit
MESHGGDVELLGIADGVARMRLVGHCDGCPASESTLELAIKKALEETAPDLEGLEVEGVAQAPAPPFELPVVQSNGAPPAWTDLDGSPPTPGLTAPMTVGGADVLMANVGGTLLAYRNACGWCRARLDDARMTPSGTLTCPSCERRFELRRAGRSPDDDALQIAPVPLLRGEGRVRVAVA